MPSKQEGSESVYIKNGVVLRGSEAQNARAADSAKQEPAPVVTKNQPLVPGSFTTTSTTFSTHTSTSYSKSKDSGKNLDGQFNNWWTQKPTASVSTNHLNLNSVEPYLKTMPVTYYSTNYSSAPKFSSANNSPLSRSPVNNASSKPAPDKPVPKPRKTVKAPAGQNVVEKPVVNDIPILTPKAPVETSIVVGSIVVKIAGVTITNMNVDNSAQDENFDVYISGEASYLGKGVQSNLNITSPSLNFDIPFLEDLEGIITWDQHANSAQKATMSSDDMNIEVEIEIEKVEADCDNCNNVTYDYNPWETEEQFQNQLPPVADFSWMDQYRPDIPEDFSKPKGVPASPNRRTDKENESLLKRESPKELVLEEPPKSIASRSLKTPVPTPPLAPWSRSAPNDRPAPALNSEAKKQPVPQKESPTPKISPASSKSLIDEPKAKSPVPSASAASSSKSKKELSVEERLQKMRNMINGRLNELSIQKKLQDEEAEKQAEHLRKLQEATRTPAPVPSKPVETAPEEETKIVKCKNHPPHITCMNCLNNNTGKDVKKLTGNIYGFN